MVKPGRWQKNAWNLVLACVLISIVIIGVIATVVFSNDSPINGTDGDEKEWPVKIAISETGMVQLGLNDLAESGFIFSVSNPENYLLSNAGETIPFWISSVNRQPVLRFYGQESQSRYSEYNIYWLEKIGARSDATHSTQEIESPTLKSELLDTISDLAYPARLRLEQNLVYEPQTREGDHWFWTKLTAPTEWSIEADLNSLVSSEATLRIQVWGKSEAPGVNDHHALFLVNGQTVADTVWDGRGEHVFQASIPGGVLQEGKNSIEIQAPGDSEAIVDVLLVNWVELEYPRRFVAEKDRLEFLSPGGSHSLSGFSGMVDIYDTTDPMEPVLAIEASHPERGYRFEAGRRYTVIGETGYHRPDRIEVAALEPDLTSSSIAADYIALGAEELLKPLEPLLDWRRQQGLDVIAVPLQVVYDQFNHGMPEPQAIQTFLSYAATKWTGPPKYVLLIGDTSYDPRGYLSPSLEYQLPTFLVDTVFGGETASDYAFTLPVNTGETELGSIAPEAIDFSIGRIPARKQADVSNFVEKIIGYEKNLISSPGDEWQRRIVAIADSDDAGFLTDAQEYLKLFTADFSTQLIGPEIKVDLQKQAIRDQFDSGSKIVAYFGHGSVNMWGRSDLLPQQDINELQNGNRLPIVLQFTCLTGLFTHPQIESLAESMLLHPGGGAVAVLAPSSLTLPDDQYWMSKTLAQAFIDGTETRLGDIMVRVYAQMQSAPPGLDDIIHTFIFFGDPALVVKQ